MIEIKLRVFSRNLAVFLESKIKKALKDAGFNSQHCFIEISDKPCPISCGESNIPQKMIKVMFSKENDVEKIREVFRSLNMRIQLLLVPCEWVPAEEMQTLSAFIEKEMKARSEIICLREELFDQVSFEAVVVYLIDGKEREQKAISGDIQDAFFQVLKKIPRADKATGIAEESVRFFLNAVYLPTNCSVFKIPKEYWEFALIDAEWRDRIKLLDKPRK